LNYTLQIDLVGAEKAIATLDRLGKGTGSIGGKMPSFDKWLDYGPSDGEKVGEKIGASVAKGVAKSKIRMGELLSSGIATLFNPFVGARMLSNIIGKAAPAGIEGGLFGKGGAIGYGEIFVAVKLLSAAFNSLRNAVNNAKTIYSKSLNSGLGVGFTTQRSVQANLLGVSEQEVLRFGVVLGWLNPRIKDSVDTLAKTAVPLATISMNFSILKLKMEALSAVVVNDLKPVIDDFTKGMESLANTIKSSEVLSGGAWLIIKTVQGIGLIFSTFALGLATIEGAIIHLLSSIANLMDKLHLGHSGSAMLGNLATESDKQVLAMSKGVQDQWKALTGQTKPASANLPSPQSWMKQMGASSWEKLGLVVAGGGNTTNDLIKKSNSYLKTIAVAVTRGIPRGNQGFGLDPSTSNP